VLILGGGGALIWARSATAAPTVQTIAATTTTLQQTVATTGTIAPATESDLSFSTSGTVETVNVKVGQTVTEGQPLATIDPTSLQSSVAIAQAQVAQAEAAVTAAASGTTAQQTSAQAQLASSQANLQQAQTALAGATITAPITGVVAAVNITAGTAWSAGSGSSSPSSSASSSSRGAGGSGSGGGSSAGGSAAAVSTSSSSSSAAISVITTNAWIVNASVGSIDLPNIKSGLQAQITPTGSTQTLFGTVQSVGIVGTSSSGGAAAFPVVIAVTGSPSGMYSGTTANVSIIVKQLSNVLVVPTLAVRTENGKSVVTVSKNGQDSVTDVTVGQVFGSRTQITKGLTSGELVVVPVYTPSAVTGAGTTGTGSRTFGGGFGGGGFGGGRTGGGRTGGGSGAGGGSSSGSNG